MLVSLDKNKWLFDWMQDNWQDEIYVIITQLDPYVKRPSVMRKLIGKMLQDKGYKVKITSKHDLIIAMKEEEFIFLKLKYS
jgi:hypothetical protein